MTDPRTLAFGDRSLERAVAWSAVGFLLAFYAVPGVALVSPDATVWVSPAVTALAGVGAIALGATDRSVLAPVVLAFGPLAGVSLRTVEPAYVATPYVEPLAVAALVAVAVGVAGYVAGRGVAAIATDRAGDDAARGSDEGTGPE